MLESLEIMLERMNPWTILFKKPPDQLPPMMMMRKNVHLEGVVTNIKLLYKFVHEQANVTKADEHLRDARLEAMLNIVDDIKSRLLESNVTDKKDSQTGELRRCSSSLATASSDTSAAAVTKPIPLNPSSTKEQTAKPHGLSLITPPSSPSSQPHKIMTPPISPKPRRAPPPLSLPVKPPLQEMISNNYDAIVQENSLLKRKLAAAVVARDSAEKVCKTIYKDTESVARELRWRVGQLEEANESVKYLSALNQRLYNKLSGQGTVEGLTEELVQRNKELMQRIEKAREEYGAILGTLKEGLDLNKRLALEMETCNDMLSKVRTERGKELEIPQLAKLKKILAKVERYLTSWQVRLRDSPLKNID
ncbi:myosin heavy chain-like protein [Carex rostrata]